MAFLDDNAKELLSGFLDGELTASEAMVAQRLLQESGEAREELRRLQAIRVAFQSTPKLHLSGDFAARVLEASERRAISMGHQQPAWLGGVLDRPTRASSGIMSEDSRREGRRNGGRWAWGVLSTMAASGLLVCLSYWDAQDGSGAKIQGLAGLSKPSVSSREGVERRDENTVASASDERLKTDVELKVGEPQEGVRTESQLADMGSTRQPSLGDGMPSGVGEVEGPGSVANRESAVAKSSDANPTAKSIADNSANNSTMANSPDPKKGAAKGDLASLLGASQEEQLKQLEALANGTGSLMMVVDFSVSKEVWDSNFVPTLLSRYDVAFDGPAVVDDQMLEQLKTSRMVGPLDGQPDPSTDVALVFVKARATRIEKMIEEIAVNPRDFPEFSFDLSMDLALQHGLSTIREFQESPQAADTARVLDRRSNRADRSLARFAPPERPRKVVGLEQRQRWTSPPMVDEKMNPVSYTLLIIRPASEKR